MTTHPTVYLLRVGLKAGQPCYACGGDDDLAHADYAYTDYSEATLAYRMQLPSLPAGCSIRLVRICKNGELEKVLSYARPPDTARHASKGALFGLARDTKTRIDSLWRQHKQATPEFNGHQCNFLFSLERVVDGHINDCGNDHLDAGGGVG